MTIITSLKKIGEIKLYILIAIAIFAFLISAPLIYFTFNNNFYMHQLEKNNVANNIENSELLTQNIINYLKGKEQLNSQFTENEINHMKDVKSLIHIARFILILSSIIIIFSIIAIFFHRKIKRNVLKSFFFGAISTIAVIAFFALSAIFNFQSSFRIFHELFFPQGNWTFPQNSILITLLPEQFFISTSQAIFISVFILGIIIIGITYFLLRKK